MYQILTSFDIRMQSYLQLMYQLATRDLTSNSHDWHISHTPYETNLAIQINILSDLPVIFVCAMDSLIGSID